MTTWSCTFTRRMIGEYLKSTVCLAPNIRQDVGRMADDIPDGSSPAAFAEWIREHKMTVNPSVLAECAVMILALGYQFYRWPPSANRDFLTAAGLTVADGSPLRLYRVITKDYGHVLLVTGRNKQDAIDHAKAAGVVGPYKEVHSICRLR